MRIVEDNPSQLILQDRTSSISFICWAVALCIGVFAFTNHELKALGSAALFLLFGIGFFRSSKIVFDKESRSCIVKRQDMGRVSRTAVPFDAIEDVLVKPMIGNESPSVTPCRLSLLTRTGEIPLSSSYEPDLDRFEKMRGSLLDTIFEKGFSLASADPVRALVAEGRPIDAVALLRRRERLGLLEAKRRIETLQIELARRPQ